MTHLSFEDFNFEVINVENPKANVLTINKGAISFDRSIAENLKFLSHIRPLIDRENRIFAIQSCRSIASKSVSFSKPESKQKGSVKIQSIVVRNAIKMLMKDKWNEDKRYQIEGKYIEEHKAFIFDLNEYKELPLFKIERKEKSVGIFYDLLDKIDVLNQSIEESIDNLEEQAQSSLDKNDNTWETVNEFFLKMIDK